MENHQENLSEVKKAKEFIQGLRFQQEQLTAKELDEILGKVIANERPVHRSVAPNRTESPFVISQWLRVAAILILPLLAAVLINGFFSERNPELLSEPVEWITLENPKGRKSKVTLPDGTQVNLNYESQLKFPKVFEGATRTVELIGEAFFDVVPMDTMPFIVLTGEVETMVLGTSFNIRSFEDEGETRVSLVTGKVKVNNTGRAISQGDMFLSPGEQLRFNRNSGQMQIDSFDVETVTAWKEGVILFKDANFEEFVEQLEKWYGVDFQVYGTSAKKWRVNGRYQNEKLDDILVGLKFVYGLDSKIQGKNVIIKFE